MSRHSHTGTSFLLMLAALLLPLASLGGDGAGSCNNTASGFCNEFTGSSYKAERVKRSCKGQGGAFLAGACPTEGRVGTCRVNKGRNDESLYRYYKNFPGFGVKPKGGVAAAAERQCAKLKGEWTPN
ncbi:MAG: hypothetical protein ACYC34_06225 [Desulfobacteria bacterium]|nr:hypothetical protein [Deltaproteobacteria bacterium]